MNERTEFGATRTMCACQTCIRNCKFIPGFLIPSDLGRLIPKDVDPLMWAQKHLLASEGAIVKDRGTGRTFRIPTLVPRTAGNDSMTCHWLGTNDRCDVHADAPFGCSFFDCQGDEETSKGLVLIGLRAIAEAFSRPGSTYAEIWHFLNLFGYRSIPPEVSRAAMGLDDQELK